MNKTLVFGAATAAVALTLGTCRVMTEPVETLYGPPPEDVSAKRDSEQTDPTNEASTTDTEQNGTSSSSTTESPVNNDDSGSIEPVETLYGPPVTDDNYYDEPVEDLYGPPVDEDTIDFGEDVEGQESTRIVPALYGPPPGE